MGLLIGSFKLIFYAFYYSVINIPFQKKDNRFLRCINFLNVFYWFNHGTNPGIRVRKYLEAMGPMFIKFGQLLSTRNDILGNDFTVHLQELTDSCKPFSSNKALNIFKESLDESFDNIFSHFELEPLASASLAQVHRATLKINETKVVIKILRPNIERSVKSNLRLLSLFRLIINITFKDSKRLKLKEVIKDYRRTLLNELDLRIEALNTVQTKKNFINSELLFIPKVFDEFTRHNILVTEEIHGIQCTDIKEIENRGINRRALAENGVRIFLDQVFRDNFFHADMHPGNIFVDGNRPEKNSYIAIDCAIVGSLADDDLYGLARMLNATIKNDYLKLAKLFISSGWVDPSTDIIDLQQTLRVCCDPIFKKPLAEIEFGKLLMSLFDSTRKFNLTIQPSLILLQKTLVHIEGMGRQIYPNLDFWSIAGPYLDRWILEKYHPKKILEFLSDNKVEILEKTKELPLELLDIFEELKKLASEPDINLNHINELRLQLRMQKLFTYGLMIGFVSIILLYLFAQID